VQTLPWPKVFVSDGQTVISDRERSRVHGTPVDLQEFAARYTSAWRSQNAARVAAFFSPNGTLSVNDGAAAVGRKAIEETVQSFMTAFPDLRIYLDNLAVVGDRVDITGPWSARTPDREEPEGPCESAAWSDGSLGTMD
jgi:uncharacterized protein (TIGR02246 family)